MGLFARFNGQHLLLWVLTLVCLALVLWLITATFVERNRAAAKLRHRQKVRDDWRVVFLTLKTFGKQPSSVPTLPRTDVRELARYWVEHINSVDGEARAHLIALGHGLKLADKMRGNLSSRNPGLRVLAVCVAGWLNDTAAYPALRSALKSDNPTLAFTAAMALLRMDAENHAPLVFARARQGDWGAGYIAKVLRELKQRDTSQEVLALLEVLGPKQGGTLMQSWAQVNEAAALAYARGVLANPKNEGWLLCGALRVLKSPADASLVRPFLAHALWSVRVQAVNAIARLGLRQDVERLAEFMTEDNWWLQERALDAVQEHPQISAKDAAALTERMLAMRPKKENV